MAAQLSLRLRSVLLFCTVLVVASVVSPVSFAYDGQSSLAAKGTALNPAAIRFSQSSVSGVEEIAASMRANGWQGVPIDVVRMSDGALTTFDNTRVLAASRAGIDVQAVVREVVEGIGATVLAGAPEPTSKVGAAILYGKAADHLTAAFTDKGLAQRGLERLYGADNPYIPYSLLVYELGTSPLTTGANLPTSVRNVQVNDLIRNLKWKPDCAAKGTAYRVEGLPNTRVLLGEGGQVSVQGDQMFFLNFGDKARAEQFLATRLQQGMPGAQMKSFEVPKSFLNDLRASAVPESMAKQFPGRPLLVDPTKAADQFGLRPDQIEALRQAIIQGSGRAH